MILGWWVGNSLALPGSLACRRPFGRPQQASQPAPDVPAAVCAPPAWGLHSLADWVCAAYRLVDLPDLD